MLYFLKREAGEQHLLIGKLQKILCPIILLLLCLAAYKDSLHGDFVFDDTVAIVRNTDVTRLPTNYAHIYQHDFWGVPLHSNESHKSFRPLTTLMFHWEYAHFGWRARQMKAINLMLHCINSLLVWWLLKRIQLNVETRESAALIAAALFAVHPVHTEAVAGIVGRAELLFALHYLLALCITVKPSQHSFHNDSLILVLTAVGMMCKESAITIPIACIFLTYMQQGIYRQSLTQQRQFLCSTRHMCYGLATLSLVLGRLWLQDFKGPHFKVMDNPVAFSELPLTRILSRNYVYALNFWLLVCPQWLSFDWALGCLRLINDMWDLRLQLVLLLYSVVIVMLMSFRRNACLILGFGLLVIPFLPASGIINVGFVIAERVLYVPSIGYCYFMAQAFVQLKNSLANSAAGVNALKWLLLCLILVFLLRTRERARDWLTEEKLFNSALDVCPNNAKVHYNIARVSSNVVNSRQKAIVHYKRAIELYPKYEAALMNLGNLYREMGELDVAETYIRQALSATNEEFPAAWMNLGIVLSAQKKYKEALYCYEQALKQRKNYAVCHYNMGNLYLEEKNYSEAMKHWRHAVSMNPLLAKAWANILTFLDNRGLYEDVVRLSEEALSLHLPEDISIMFIRANVLGKLKHFVEAENLFKRILAIDATNILYHTNLGVLYHRWGKYDEAIDSYRNAIAVNGKTAHTAQTNLKKLLERLENNK